MSTPVAPTSTFRPKIAYVATGLWALVTVAWIVFAARASGGELLRQLPVVAFFGAAVYATCTRPVIAVRTDDVLLRNALRDVTVPWSALAAIETKYALTLITLDGRRFPAWAAPASGRLTATRGGDADTAALAVQSGWHAWRDRGSPPDDTPASVRWSVPVTAILALTLVAAVAVLILA